MEYVKQWVGKKRVEGEERLKRMYKRRHTHTDEEYDTSDEK